MVTSPKKPKIVVYTAVADGYDTIRGHSYVSDQFDYVFSADSFIADRNAYHWDIRPMIEFDHSDPTMKARYYKLHPHLLFPDYDFSIWIDGTWDISGPHLEKMVNRELVSTTVSYPAY